MPAVIGPRNFRLWVALTLCLWLGAWCAVPAGAQTVVVDTDAELSARRATTWQADGAEHLLLEGETTFRMGAYGFRAERAVVRIVTEERDEQTVRHLAVYLDNARPLRGDERSSVVAEADRLLVTGATAADVQLAVDAMREAEAPLDDAFVVAGRERFARHDRQRADRLAGDAVGEAAPPLLAGQTPDESEGPEDGELSEPVSPRTDTVLPNTGTVRFHAERVVAERGDDEVAVMLIGDVRLIYEGADDGRAVVLQAERAVVFLQDEADDELAGTAVDAGAVTGVYLEENIVITDGDFTLRAPRIFYDLRGDRAAVLDAVLYTWDVRRQIPLYLRADSVRQTSRTSFEARGAILTTSEFARPQLGIGANRVTLDLERDAQGVTRQHFTASHATLRAADVPVFYWPYLAGEVGNPPIRGASLGRSQARGLELETTWDVFTLLGLDPADDIDLTADVDYRGRSGPGLGSTLSYDFDGIRGELRGYALPIDSAHDRIGNRERIGRDDDTRGFIHLQHRQPLPDDWQADVEAAYVSDELFLESFFPDEAYEARSYQTSLYLLRQQPEWAVDLQAGTQLTDFTEQLTTLQTPGFQLVRQPELGYFRTGTSLFDGRVTWYSENRFSRLRADFGRDTPADRGFTESQALGLFGISRDTSFHDAADAAGFPQDWRLRADSRHEFTAPLEIGPLSITPYTVGRVTAYDDNFEAYAGEHEQYRLWGSVGTRASTQFQRSYDGVNSDVLNLNRLRHLIEPSVNAYYSDATVAAGDLPPFEADVEDLADGPGVRLGLRQTLQTQRGGPGRWRSVDWITLDTDLVFRSRESGRDRQPLARFYDYRPEYAAGGDHFHADGRWQVSDMLGAVGELTYDFHDDHVSQWRLGASLQHTPRLSSFLQYRNVRPIRSRWLSYGFTYVMTPKYTLSATQRYDLGDNRSRHLDLWLERRLPRARLRLIASFDQIDNEQVFGITFTPEGFNAGNPFDLTR